jgi:hypothetical protein
MGGIDMYDLSKKEANSLIEIIHESLNCDTLSAFHRLVRKLRHLTADNLGVDLPRKAGEYASPELRQVFPGKNYPGPCSRAEVI